MTLVGRDTTKLEACCESATAWWLKACAQSSFLLVSSRYCTRNLEACCRYSRQVVLLSSAHSFPSPCCPSAAVCAQEGVNQSVCLFVCLLLLTLFSHYVFSKIEEVSLRPLSHWSLLLPLCSSVNVLLFVFIFIFLSPVVVLCSSQGKVFEQTGDTNYL